LGSRCVGGGAGGGGGGGGGGGHCTKVPDKDGFSPTGLVKLATTEGPPRDLVLSVV